MKKSILIFILWAVAGAILTCINIILARFDPVSGWIVCLCAFVMTLAMLSLTRTVAKSEQVTWLAVVSKALMIVYCIWGAVGLVLFVLSRMIP